MSSCLFSVETTAILSSGLSSGDSTSTAVLIMVDDRAAAPDPGIDPSRVPHVPVCKGLCVDFFVVERGGATCTRLLSPIRVDAKFEALVT